VGRDDVLARLHRAVDEALAGAGQVVLLTGEAGIGKTTMLAEAARYAADRGARVAWGWGWPADGAPGYWPWVQVTRGLGLGGPLAGDPAPALAQAATSEAPGSARFQLFDEVSALLLAESRIQPVVIILDDLHWADRSSLLLLDFLARRLPVGAATVLGAYRAAGAPGSPGGTAGPGSPLSGLTAPSTVVPLAGLTADAVEQLVASVTGELPGAAVAADVRQRTGGNPFFVEQLSWLMQAGGSGVPPGAREALAERFSALTADCAATVSAASVIGQRFSADLAAAAAGQAPARVADRLAEAARAGLLVQHGLGAFRFTHDLFREYAGEMLPADQLARAHQRVGAALEAERARGGEASLAELAGHFTRADPASEKAYHYSAAAAAEASSRLAYDEAAAHWETALAATGPGAARRTQTLLRLGEARWRAGQGAAAAEAYARAAELARRENDGPGLAQAALGVQAIGVRSWWPPDELVALLSEATAALPRAGDSAPESGEADRSGSRLLRLRVMASLARTLAWHGRQLTRARTLAAQAVASARDAGDEPTLAVCLLAQHNAIWAPGTAAQRRQLAAEVAALAERTGDTELLIEARVLGTADLLELASPSFRAELDEFLRLADVSGQPRFRYSALVRRATLALLAGRLAEAGRLIDQAVMLGDECGEPQAADVWGDQTWDLFTAQGRRAELRDISDSFPDPESRQARGLRALTLLAAGEEARAAEVAAPLLAGGPVSDEDTGGEVPPAGLLLDACYGTEMVAGLGATGPAKRLYQALAPFAGQAVVSGAAITFKGVVDHHLGVLAALLGRDGEAAARLEQAIAAHDRLGALPWTLRSRYELARVRLADPARREQARAELAEVAGAAHQLGMAQVARDAAGAAQAAGTPTGAVQAAGTPAAGTPAAWIPAAGDPADGRTAAGAGVFRRDGAIWTLSYAGATVRMRDAKGLADLAALLAAPGRPVLAADLVAAAGAGDLARAALAFGGDDLLDETARRQIRGRLTDLDEEIDEAEQWSDPERAARAREEREALAAHLAAATGLAGRHRRLGDESERARKTVTARIRDVIGKIEQSHPPLGAHLRASVTTGTHCTYSPPGPVTWQL
jgi:AAA ATPase domain